MAHAKAITTLHADLFSGWFGGSILLTEFGGVGGQAFSYLYEPESGDTHRIAKSMVLPSVDGQGRYIVYWSGTTRRDSSSGLWQPVNGSLYFDSWDDMSLLPASLDGAGAAAAPSQTVEALDADTATENPTSEPSASSDTDTTASPTDSPSPTPTATPTATPTSSPKSPSNLLPRQLPVMAVHSFTSGWATSWDASGEHLAVWVANPALDGTGGLKVLEVDPKSGVVQTDPPLLSVYNTLASIQFDGIHVVYTLSSDGKTHLVPIPGAVPTRKPTATPVATPTATPTPEPTPELTPTAEPTPTPEPSASPSVIETEQASS